MKCCRTTASVTVIFPDINGSFSKFQKLLQVCCVNYIGIYIRLLHTNSRCFPVKKKPGIPLIPDWHPCFGKLNFSQLLNYIFYITLNYFMKFAMSLKTRFSILERTKKKAVDCISLLNERIAVKVKSSCEIVKKLQ